MRFRPLSTAAMVSSVLVIAALVAIFRPDVEHLTWPQALGGAAAFLAVWMGVSAIVSAVIRRRN